MALLQESVSRVYRDLMNECHEAVHAAEPIHWFVVLLALLMTLVVVWNVKLQSKLNDLSSLKDGANGLVRRVRRSVGGA